MRKIVVALITATGIAFGVVPGAIPSAVAAAPGGGTARMCVVDPLHSTGEPCVTITVPGLPPTGPCEQPCPYAVVLGYPTGVPDQVRMRVGDGVRHGMSLLGDASVQPDPSLAAQLRSQALAAFLDGAAGLGTLTLGTAQVGYLTAAGTFVPEPMPWRQELGDDLTHALTLLQHALADPPPAPWQAQGMAAADAAYSVFRQHALPANCTQTATHQGGTVRRTLTALAAASALASATPAASAAQALPTTSAAGFVLGADGGLYAAGPLPGGTAWTAPTRVTPANVGPPGGSVAGARRPDGTMLVAWAGTDGKVHGALGSTGAQWPTVAALGPRPVPAGSPVAAVSSPAGVAVFAVDQGGAIALADLPGPVSRPPALQAITATGTAQPYSPVYAQRRLTGEYVVAYHRTTGGIGILQSGPSGQWSQVTGIPGCGWLAGSVRLPSGTLILVCINGGAIVIIVLPAGGVFTTRTLVSGDVLDAGSNLTAVVDPAGLVDVVYAGRDGALMLARVAADGQPAGSPVALSPARTVAPGAPLALSLSPTSNGTRYDFDGDLCPRWRWPLPWPWPPPPPPLLHDWDYLHFSIDPAGAVLNSRLGPIGTASVAVQNGFTTMVG
jgi:hypothetical protein